MNKNYPKVDLETRMNLKFEKKCACGHVHHELPEGAYIAEPFYWFDCVCKSTLVIKIPGSPSYADLLKKEAA